MAEWLTGDEALALTGKDSSDVDDTRWEGCVAGARAYIENKRSDLFDLDEGVEPAPGADVRLGTSMLAARYYDRSATPLGVQEYSEMGGTVLRTDPDITRLCGIGRFGPVVFG